MHWYDIHLFCRRTRKKPAFGVTKKSAMPLTPFHLHPKGQTIQRTSKPTCQISTIREVEEVEIEQGHVGVVDVKRKKVHHRLINERQPRLICLYWFLYVRRVLECGWSVGCLCSWQDSQ